MANPIYVWCRSDRPLTYGALEEVMAHVGMGYLDHPVTFDPPPDKADPADAAWREIQVAYHGGKRPIDIYQWLTPEEMRPTLTEILERLANQGAGVDHPVVAHLNAARQVIVFELPDDLPEDVWEMLDMTEGYIAREHDGLIVAHEGVFDAELAPLVTWSD